MGCGDGPLSMPWLVRSAWIVPATALMLFLALPVAWVLGQVPVALTASGDGLPALAVPSALAVLPLALLQAALSTVLAVLVGLPICAVVSRYSFRGRSLVEALVTVPFVLPTVVIALAIRTLLGADAPLGLGMVILAHAYVNLAVIVRLVGASWLQVDPAMAQAARTLGASAWSAFRTVTLPALRGAIATSAAVVFAFSFTSLGIALLLGGGQVRTLEMLVLRQSSVLLDFPGAALSAVVQLLVVTTVIVLGTRAARRTRTHVHRRLPMPRQRTARVAILAVAVSTCAIVLAPLLALLWASVHVGSEFTTSWWTGLGSIDAGTTRIGAPIDALRTSLLFALATAVIAGAIGCAAALGALAGRVGRTVAVIALAPLGVSAATLGLGLLLAFGRPPVDLRAIGILVPMAHALIAVPLVVAVALPALRSIDDRRRGVAATLGARPLRAFGTTYGSALRVVVIASAGLAAAVSLGEFGAASFLARSGSPTTSMVIVRLLSRPGEAATGTAAAMSVLLVIATVLLVLGVDRAGRRMVSSP